MTKFKLPRQLHHVTRAKPEVIAKKGLQPAAVHGKAGTWGGGLGVQIVGDCVYMFAGEGAAIEYAYRKACHFGTHGLPTIRSVKMFTHLVIDAKGLDPALLHPDHEELARLITTGWKQPHKIWDDAAVRAELSTLRNSIGLKHHRYDEDAVYGCFEHWRSVDAAALQAVTQHLLLPGGGGRVMYEGSIDPPYVTLA